MPICSSPQLPVAVACIAAALRQTSARTYSLVALVVIGALAGFALLVDRTGNPMFVAPYTAQVMFLACPVVATFGVLRFKRVFRLPSAVVIGTLAFVVAIIVVVTVGADMGSVSK